MTTEEDDQPRVKFEQPLDIKVMSIDGTRSEKGRLIEIGDYQAVIELTGRAAEWNEFFLLLTSFGNPVFRRCVRVWAYGGQIGVKFNESAKELPKAASDD